MPKAYSYTRMSTPEQLKGDSKRRQDEGARQYAEEHGLEIVDRFDDLGVSAFKGKNAELGALSEFTRLVDEGVIERGSYLLVESMDRLSRQTVPRAMSLLLGLTNRGINVAIFEDNRVYSERSNEEDTFALMTALMSMSRAHDESRRKSSLLAKAWKNKRDLARTLGMVTTSKVPGWLTVEGGRVCVIPQRARVVTEIFEWTKNGYGAYSIARRLNERKEAPWSTRKNAVWRESYIKKIIKSRTVLGEYQPHTVITVAGKITRVPEGEPLIGYYPAIIPMLLFQEANAAMAQRSVSGRGRKGHAYSNLFTGLLRCRCGAGYRYIDKGSPPKGGNYLQCSVSFSKGACTARAMRYETFEAILLEAIDRLDVGSLLGGSKLPQRVRELKEKRAELVERSRREEAEAGNILDAIKQGGSGSRLLGAELAKLEASISSMRVEIADIEQELDDLGRIDPERRKAQLRTLMTYMESATGEDRTDRRRALAGELQRLLKKVVVTPREHYAWELMEEFPDWALRYRVKSKPGLERLCRERCFELLLVYRTGDTLQFDAMDGEFFKARKDVRMKSIEFRAG